MPKKRSWTDEQLIIAVKANRSYAAVIKQIGLVPAGGNYDQVQRITKELGLDTSHFTGMGWNIGLIHRPNPPMPLEQMLVADRATQSYSLKKRLYAEGFKKPECEICGWAKVSPDGRIPVELDHVNGIHSDNRLENLRILCPNCHSLQLTHRGRNKKVRYISAGAGTR
jgi:hypothetical protein